MKKTLLICLAIALLFSFAACTAKTTKTMQTAQATEQAIPEPTKEPSPTSEPTPTPELTPTPEPEPTEAEKMCLLWLESAKDLNFDIYACLLTKTAYDNGELDRFVKEGILTEEDIQTLSNSYYWFTKIAYPVSVNILSDDYSVDELEAADLAIAILRGDAVKASGDQLEEAFTAVDWLMKENYFFVSTLPEESRDDVYELMDIIYDRVEIKKDVTDLEEVIYSCDLDMQQKWLIFSYILAWPGISPEVIYNGKETQLIFYLQETDICPKFTAELQDAFEAKYLKDKADNVDFFGLEE